MSLVEQALARVQEIRTKVKTRVDEAKARTGITGPGLLGSSTGKGLLAGQPLKRLLEGRGRLRGQERRKLPATYSKTPQPPSTQILPRGRQDRRRLLAVEM